MSGSNAVPPAGAGKSGPAEETKLCKLKPDEEVKGAAAADAQPEKTGAGDPASKSISETAPTGLFEVHPFEETQIVSEGKPKWQRPSIFSDRAQLVDGIPVNVESLPTIEQARIFLERYPNFHSLGEISNFSDASPRWTFLKELSDTYKRIFKTMVDDGKGHWIDANWQQNFEWALDSVIERTGIDVRNGFSIADGEIVGSWEIDDGQTLLLEIGKDYLQERTAGWSEKLRPEFIEVYESKFGSVENPETIESLEKNFQRGVEIWLEYHRGIPTDVTAKIQNMGVPLRDIPRVVELAAVTNGLTPPQIPEFVADLQGLEAWLGARLSQVDRVHPYELGGKPTKLLAREMVDSVMRTGLGFDQARGLLSMATDRSWYSDDPGFEKFKENIGRIEKLSERVAAAEALAEDRLVAEAATRAQAEMVLDKAHASFAGGTVLHDAAELMERSGAELIGGEGKSASFRLRVIWEKVVGLTRAGRRGGVERTPARAPAP